MKLGFKHEVSGLNFMLVRDVTYAQILEGSGCIKHFHVKVIYLFHFHTSLYVTSLKSHELPSLSHFSSFFLRVHFPLFTGRQ